LPNEPAAPGAGATRWPLLPLDELKGLGLILVVIYHSTGVLHLPDWSHGELGVDLFLLISGYAVAGSARRWSTRDFAARRFWRIFPAYWCALALFVVLDQKFQGIVYSWHSLGLHVLGLHAFGPEVDFWGMNMSFWFMALLIPMYGCALALKTYRGPAANLVAWGLTAAGFASLLYDQMGFHGHVEHLTVRIPSFFLGLAAARFETADPSQRRLTPFLGAAIIFAFALYIVRGYAFYYTPEAVFLIVAYLGLRGVFASFGLAWLLALIGTYSYEIFLFHQPFIIRYGLITEQKLFPAFAATHQTPGWGIGVGLAITIILAVPLHHLLGLKQPGLTQRVVGR